MITLGGVGRQRAVRSDNDSGGLSGLIATIKPWLSVIAVVSVSFFAGVVWFFYDSQNSVQEPPPVIRADNSPTKVRPDEPGGREIPDQDKLVFEGEAADDANADDGLRPADEEPLPDNTAASSPVVVAAPEPEPEAEPEVVSTPAPPPANVTLQITDSDYLVQLGAYRGPAGADSAWSRLSEAHSDLLAGFSSDVLRIDAGDRGIFYRLRAGPLFSENEARQLCERLHGRDVACLIVRP